MVKIGRRSVLQAAAALAAPAVVAAEATRVMRFIPQIDLVFIDPHTSTTNITRNHAGLVFDQLWGTDSNYRAQPQMVEGHVVEDDGLTWRIRLRDGLRWHDGAPVLARDCVASIRRWGARDVLGMEILAISNEITTPDDRTIVFRLKRPFPLLPEALGKPGAFMPAMMPERLALTDPFKPVAELIGSGPYKFVANERLQGVRNVYERFGGYVPRPHGTPDRGTGPKITHFDRVVWTTMPDIGTAFASLQKGEQDWWEYAAHDLLPSIRRDPKLHAEVLETEGEFKLVRFNHTIAPFDRAAMRQVILRAVDQSDFVNAVAGVDASLQRTGVGFFPPGPSANDAGMDRLKKPLDVAAAKAALAAAGYKGERIVQVLPGDYPNVKAASEVLADLLKRIGINLDLQVTDWSTMTTRVSRKDPIDKGGFHIHMLSIPGLALATPLVNSRLRGNETVEAGWYNGPNYEAIRTRWATTTDLAQRAAYEREIQLDAMETVPFVPCGVTMQPSAWRSDLTGVLPGVAKFWNVRRI